MKTIYGFEYLSKRDIAVSGGKGALLGEMLKAGISVPYGFVISTNVFDRFLQETGLNTHIKNLLTFTKDRNPQYIESISKLVTDKILESNIPEDIEKEILASFKDLKEAHVAVRSSATTEDSEDAAWAGQLETYLNTTEENLIQNIKRCWGSLFAPRVMFYSLEKGLIRKDISVGIVVQKMIESEKSGVAFSVHPISQDPNQLIIEAGYGLGEAIVSGQVSPDSYVVDKNTKRILDKKISTQHKALHRKEGGGNQWLTVEGNHSSKQVLTDVEIIDLANKLMEIEGCLGFPCDVEWAIEAGFFHFLQFRPITTLIRKK